MKDEEEKVSTNKSRGKGRKQPQRKGKFTKSKVKEVLENKSEYGNPNWYFIDKDLAEQASRFSFQSFVGNGVLTNSAVLPSMCIIGLNPSIGDFVTPGKNTAAVNLTARKLYAQLSNKSGRTANYAPQDVMTIILAMGEVLSYASYLKRAFGLAFTYSKRNRDLPKQLIQAMSISADDFFKNLAPYRVRLNTILATANKIPVPANIAWFEKCDALYQMVFKDSPDDMSELYAFVPATTWTINEGSYAGGTVLETTQAAYNTAGAPAVRTMASHLDTLQSMVEKLLTSSSYNIIYADILNYCQNKDVPMLQFSIVPEDYVVTPEYNEETLLHIHNMTVLPFPSITETVDITDETNWHTDANTVYPDPDNNNLIYMPVFSLPNSSELLPGIFPVLDDMDLVDFPYGNPDLTERLEATRLAVRFDSFARKISSQEGLFVRPSALPDHYAVGVRLYNAGVSIGLPASYNSLCLADVADPRVLAWLEKFRYHYLQYRIPSDYTNITYVTGEINYFTKLNAEWLSRLNTLCYQGLFELR